MNFKKITTSFLTLTFLATTSIYANENINNDTQTRLEALQKLTKVIGTVEKYYVDDIQLNEIVDKALKGLMQELDAHSTYMDAKHFKEMQIQTAGEFGGLGIVVGMRDGALTVISPIDDTPAYKAGVQSGDIVLKIDDKSTLNMSLEEAVNLMRGKPKTKITLTLVRKSETKPIKIEIIRDIIKVQSVTAKKIENSDVLYVRVASFDKNVTEELKAELLKHKDAKGILLDLRNNPGGLLNQAIGIVDLFVDKGVIVSQKGRAQEEETFEAAKDTTISKLPIAVLVNGGSASASEIVAGAMQDLKRAIVVGQKTFGKGSVQIVLPVTNDQSEGIKLTIAKYYLPSGRTIQATGITPDIMAYPGNAVVETEDEFKIKEADLKKHLEGELEKTQTNNQQKEDGENNAEEELNKKLLTQKTLNEDNQLTTALNVLKSLMIMNK